MALIPVKNMPAEQKEVLRKPEWMKIKLPSDSHRIQEITRFLCGAMFYFVFSRPLLTKMNPGLHRAGQSYQ